VLIFKWIGDRVLGSAPYCKVLYKPWLFRGLCLLKVFLGELTVPAMVVKVALLVCLCYCENLLRWTPEVFGLNPFRYDGFMVELKPRVKRVSAFRTLLPESLRWTEKSIVRRSMFVRSEPSNSYLRPWCCSCRSCA